MSIEIINRDHGEPQTIPMSAMKPLQVGVLVKTGEYVMRTAFSRSFEVMSLASPKENDCWVDTRCSAQVRLLGEGESITLKISND